MSIKINNQNIVAIYKGGQSITYVYKGTDLVWYLDPLDEYIYFLDPEVGRVLHANGLIRSPIRATKRELAAIRSLNPNNTYNGSYFYNNKVVERFPELQYCTGLTNLSNTFRGCSKLTTVAIPEGVTNMNRTFQDCSNLTTVGDVIPEGVIDLSYTFLDCTSLITTPAIPSSATDLRSAFSGCTSLTTAPVIFSSVINLGSTFWGCSSLLEAPVIPEGVTNLQHTFYGCSSLLEAPVIPEGVIDLRETFYGCSSLLEAPVIPSSVKYMYGTFRGCTSLTKAPVISNSVTNLSYTFWDCYSIDGIYIINAVEPPTYFYSLSNIRAIFVPNDSMQPYFEDREWTQFTYKLYPMSERPFEVSGTFADPEVGRVLHANGLIVSPTHSTREELATITSLNPSNTSNGSYFYNNKVITQFPELQYCTGLTDLRSTFSGCSSLTTAPVIPESVTNMEDTFNGCTKLTIAPIIPESVTNMQSTFEVCTGLDSILTIEVINPPTIDNGTFLNVTMVAIYVPNESVQLYKEALGWIQFADKIYPFSERPFEVSGIFADPEVGRVLHAYRLIASPTHSTREELATIKTLNPSGEYNTGYFFNNKVITQFPELQYCTGLTDLRSAFIHCSNLTTVGDIPEGITNLSNTFRDCTSLVTAPVIPEGVTNLAHTFDYCLSLTTAPVIPSSVTNLYYAFTFCSNLTTAPVIPDGVTDLRYTFRYCYNIDGIYIINIVEPITYEKSLSNVQTIYVPDASVIDYKRREGWRGFASKIYPISEYPK